MYVTGDGVAFRKGPGKSYSLVENIRLNKGNNVLYQGKKQKNPTDGLSWSQVIYKSKVGWVATRYLSEVKEKTLQQLELNEKRINAATANTASNSAYQSAPQTNYMPLVYCPGMEYTTTKGKLEKSLRDLLFYQENYSYEPELSHMRANEIREYLKTFAYGDPFVVEYMESNDILWAIMDSSQGSTAEDTRLVLADLRTIKHDNFDGSAHDMTTPIIGAVVAVTGVYYVGVPALKYLGAKASATIAGVGATATVTLQQAVEYVRSHLADLQMTQTVLAHTERTYMNYPAIVEWITAGTPAWDPGGLENGLKWVEAGVVNNTPGFWELVIDLDSLTIVHFLFRH